MEASVTKMQVTPTKEKRQIQAKNLARIIRSANGSDLSPDIAQQHEPDSRFDHEYGRLAESMWRKFVSQAYGSGDEKLVSLAIKPNVLHGFYVMTKLASYGPPAYANYLAAERPGKHPDVTELAEIMKDSKSALRLFTDLDNSSNRTYELNFGLLEDPPCYETTPFMISPNEKKELLFKPSPLTLENTQLEVIRTKLVLKEMFGHNPTPASCPAIGIVLNTLWCEAIDHCAQDPQLFAADLFVEAPVG